MGENTNGYLHMLEMLQKLITVALEALFKNLDAEKIKDFVDAGLDKLEDKYIDGEVDTIKEMGISGTIALIRQLLNIKDEEYGTDKVE